MGAPSRRRRGRRGEGFKLEERFVEIFRCGELAVRLFDGGSGPPQRTLQQRLPDPLIRVLKTYVSLEQRGVLIITPPPEMIQADQVKRQWLFRRRRMLAGDLARPFERFQMRGHLVFICEKLQ